MILRTQASQQLPSSRRAREIGDGSGIACTWTREGQIKKETDLAGSGPTIRAKSSLPRWSLKSELKDTIKHRGQTYDTAAMSTRATVPRGRALVVLSHGSCGVTACTMPVVSTGISMAS